MVRVLSTAHGTFACSSSQPPAVDGVLILALALIPDSGADTRFHDRRYPGLRMTRSRSRAKLARSFLGRRAD